jgi:ABC-type Na+ efflux pump permease subunit
MSSKIIAVAWREFRQTVLRPIFVIAILGIPILIIGIGVVAGVIIASHEEPPLVGAIAIVEATGEVADAATIEFDAEKIRADELEDQIQQAQETMQSGARDVLDSGSVFGNPATTPLKRGEIKITVVAELDSSEATLASLKEELRQGNFLAVAVIPQAVLELSPAREDASPQHTGEDAGARVRRMLAPSSAVTYDLFVAEGIDSDNIRLIEDRIGQSVVRVRAERVGLPPEQAIALLTPPEPTTRSMAETGVEHERGKGEEIKREILPMVFLMLIWIGVFSSAQHLMLSTIEEKSNRVMEVLLSAVSPFQLMTGKILGYGAVGLLIVTIYSSLGVAALIVLATFSDWLTWVDLAMLAIFYLMAYFMIASMMAAVGSAVTDIREANTLVTPVMLILMVPLMLWLPISQAPNGAVATTFSFVPPAIPFAMILRHVAEEPVPAWQYPATIVWGLLCTVGMVWLASKIFRVGVLMYGKPPSPIELIKWARYS